jgi:hypothetical protein
MATDIDGDGDLDPQRTGEIDVSSFYPRGGGAGTEYKATNAAANYMKPVSCYSRGGHGDVDIYTESPLIDSSPASNIPVACGSCHDATAPHFTANTSTSASTINPYRIFTAGYPGSDGSESDITNLCTQSSCHPKTSGGILYATLQPAQDLTTQPAHRHGSDYYPISGGTPKTYYVPVASKPVILSGNSDNSNPQYNPVGLSNPIDPVGIHIDRYVDHWAWWGGASQQATSSNADDHPFMPLGDSLQKQGDGNYTNQTTTTNGLVTCIACHNPHGTDLFVFGEQPDSSCASTFQAISDNNMLRLRWEEAGDDEVCSACH